jgi:hypothetical protein
LLEGEINTLSFSSLNSSALLCAALIALAAAVVEKRIKIAKTTQLLGCFLVRRVNQYTLFISIPLRCADCLSCCRCCEKNQNT